MSEKKQPRKDDYLWDRSGEPDPEVQKLETALGRYRQNQPAPSFEKIADIRPVKQHWSFFSLRWSYQLGAVAAIVLLAAAVFLVLRVKPTGNAGPSWAVARLEGAPRVGWHSMGEKSGPVKLGIGQTLVTDSSSRATITLDETGRIEVDAGSRLRLVANGPGRQRLSLERGTITPPSGRPPVNLSWIRLPLSPWISAASTLCTWTIPARASCAPPWAGLVSSCTAMNPSSLRAPS